MHAAARFPCGVFVWNKAKGSLKGLLFLIKTVDRVSENTNLVLSTG